MPQLNIHLKPDFERDLERFMKLRGLSTKSEAVRVAIREGVERASREQCRGTDFAAWRGAGLAVEPNPNPRFPTDDDLWK